MTNRRKKDGKMIIQSDFLYLFINSSIIILLTKFIIVIVVIINIISLFVVLYTL
jgi:hypothetical protein